MAEAENVGLRSLKSAERFLGVSRTQLYRLARDKEIEFIKVGRLTRVTQQSLDRYIASAARMVPTRRR